MTTPTSLYGQSLYDLAAEEGLSEEIMNEMEAVNAIFKENPDYITLLLEPSIPRRERLGMVEEAFKGQIHPYLLNFLFGLMNVDCVYDLAFHNPDSVLADAIFVFFNCILVSIISEFLFRGAILQTFRQFGDTYALIISIVSFSFTYYDVSSFGYASLLSAVLGLYTLKTGSIRTAVIMRIISSLASYSLTCVVLDNYSNGRIVVTCIYAFIVAVAAFVFARLMCNGKLDFKMQNDPSALTNSAKIKLFVTNTSTTIWLVAVLGMYVLMVKFI